MSRSAGCQPSPLIEAIFYRLPYFTSGLASNETIENIVDDLVVSLSSEFLILGTMMFVRNMYVSKTCVCYKHSELLDGLLFFSA